MPSFTSILLLLSAAASALASHQLRNHNDLAKRLDTSLSKRFAAHRVTWYPTDTGPDACTGRNHGDYDNIVALNAPQFGNTGNGNCGRKIRIHANGKTAIGVIQDKCATCYNHGEIDLTRGLFLQFATLDQGVFEATWEFADGDDGDDEPAKPPPPPKKTTKKPDPPKETKKEEPAKFVAPKTEKKASKTASKSKSSAKPSSSKSVAAATTNGAVKVVPSSAPAPATPTPTEAVGNAGSETPDDDAQGVSGGIASDGLNSGAASISFNKVVAGAAALLFAAQAL